MMSPSDEKRIVAMVDSFTKTVARNFSRNLKRAKANAEKHYSDEPVDYYNSNKEKIQRPSQENLRRLSFCPEGGGSLYAIQTQAPLFLSRLPALDLRALLRGTPENHHGAL